MGSPSAVWNEPCTPPTATPSEREQFCQKSSSEQYLRRAGQCVSVGDYRIELGCRVSNWHGVSRLRDSAWGAQLAHSKPRSSSETLPCFVTMAPAATSIFCWSMCGPKTFQLLRSGPPAVAQHILTHGIDRTRAHQLHAAGAHFSRADAPTARHSARKLRSAEEKGCCRTSNPSEVFVRARYRWTWHQGASGAPTPASASASGSR
jgi:hypothetical protein